MKPIGTLRSAFRDRRGTPRQGCLVPHSTAYIEFLPEVNAISSVSGMEEFSHVWVIGVFHENTNQGKSGGVSAKIKPPRLQGTKVGLYSTRTPHRHNPISLSLAKVDKLETVVVKGKSVTRLWLSGIDLIDSTPILDIKPYIKDYDAAPGEVRVARWVAEEDTNIGFKFSGVTISEGLIEKFNTEIADKLEFYLPSEFLVALKEILITDIRSEFQRKVYKTSGTQQPILYNFRLDVVKIDFFVGTNNTIIVKDMCIFNDNVELDKI